MTKSKYRLYSCLVNANKLLGQIYMAGLQIIHGCNLTNADLTWAGVYSNIARFHRRKVSSMVDDCLFTNRDFDMAQDFLYLFCFTITVKPDLSPDFSQCTCSSLFVTVPTTSLGRVIPFIHFCHSSRLPPEYLRHLPTLVQKN